MTGKALNLQINMGRTVIFMIMSEFPCENVLSYHLLALEKRFSKMFIIFSFNVPVRFNPSYLIILNAILSEIFLKVTFSVSSHFLWVLLFLSCLLKYLSFLYSFPHSSLMPWKSLRTINNFHINIYLSFMLINMSNFFPNNTSILHGFNPLPTCFVPYFSSILKKIYWSICFLSL